MPTVLIDGPYRFYFHSHEANEPAHMHIDRDNLSAKFWIDPVSLARNFGFAPHELKKLQLLVIKNRKFFKEAWDGYFSISRRRKS